MSTEISLWIKKILLLIAIGILSYGLYVARDIFFIIVISGFLTIIINPLVDRGEQYKIPAWITAVGVFIVIFLLGSIVIGTLIPIVIEFISERINDITTWTNTAKEIYTTKGVEGFNFHPYIEKAILFLFQGENLGHALDLIKQNAGNIQSFLTNQISSLTSGGLSIVSQVGGVITNWILIVISTFLMILERKEIGRYIVASTPRNLQKYIENHYSQTQNVFTSWIRGMLILSISIFCLTYIGLVAVEMIFGFSLEKTFTLALIGGIMEFIPYIGPLLALIPAVIIGLGISGKVAMIIVILYVVIQQTENNILVPYVMGKSLNLSPFFVFIVMLLGASLGGVLGIILAIPIAGVIRIIFEEYRKSRGDIQEAKKLTTSRKTISSKTVSK